MPKTRPPYSPEFRRQMIDLVRAGRSPEDLAREFEPTAQSIGAWAAAADKQEGRREEVVAGLAASDRAEVDVAAGRVVDGAEIHQELTASIKRMMHGTSRAEPSDQG